ncbi:inositol-3-phosphate synthase [Spongiactinospora sp. TRM90649]|uniref:inositol-3-phosphate synthase n=1 Tax=Spongiactinospora sp. TRM90649 TaxID=3031114 RepID=UPI0023FA2398|nr:inositol-3-phosphate synthase [Spongiactinospora sp. TRM90649]MDF5751639.1 inositol-3-phosphate synthase [Spongiactinospora sp. TRM90649]
MDVSGPVRLAVAGVGNNISALLQGVHLYREMIGKTGEDGLPGIRRPRIGGIGVGDVRFVAAYDVHPGKIGQDLREGAFAPPNNYPALDVEVPPQGVQVEKGIDAQTGEGAERVVKSLADAGAEVLLYSLPTGLQRAADAYAQAAVDAGVAFVNCTPEPVARNPETMARFEAAGLPLVGDDLASHLGASVVHRTLLILLAERGLTLNSSYQLNFGGNEDFRNLRDHGGSKRQSKLNALAAGQVVLDAVEVIPSAGHIAHLRDNKVAVINIEAVGWAGTPISVDLKLKVQDSSNAAGVIIDLIRIAGVCRRLGLAGFPAAAATVLKSPAGGHVKPEAAEAACAELDRLANLKAGGPVRR